MANGLHNTILCTPNLFTIVSNVLTGQSIKFLPNLELKDTNSLSYKSAVLKVLKVHTPSAYCINDFNEI